MKYFFSIAIMPIVCLAHAQYNYVPNPGFENYTEFPDQFDQTDRCPPWRSATYGSSDFLYDSDNGSSVDLPESYMGNQEPHSGNGYCGIIVYSDNSFPDYKEYLEVELTDPLIAGMPYKVSWYCSLADYVSTYASEDLGAILSPGGLGLDFQLNSITEVPPPIKYDGMIQNMSDWVLVEGVYTAQGGETHLTLGSFIESDAMDVLYLNPGGEGYAYYFIDDVSVTIDTSSGIFGENYGNGYDPASPGPNAYYEGGCLYDVIVPNVFTPQGDGINEQFFIKYNGYIHAEIVITDRWGKTVFTSTDFFTAFWNGEGMDHGVYFYALTMQKQNGDFESYTGSIQIIGH